MLVKVRFRVTVRIKVSVSVRVCIKVREGKLARDNITGLVNVGDGNIMGEW